MLEKKERRPKKGPVLIFGKGGRGGAVSLRPKKGKPKSSSWAQEKAASASTGPKSSEGGGLKGPMRLFRGREEIVFRRCRQEGVRSTLPASRGKRGKNGRHRASGSWHDFCGALRKSERGRKKKKKSVAELDISAAVEGIEPRGQALGSTT